MMNYLLVLTEFRFQFLFSVTFLKSFIPFSKRPTLLKSDVEHFERDKVANSSFSN